MNNLRSIRQEKKLSQEDLANLIGSGKSYISDLETGAIREPSLGKARLIAMALRVDVEHVFPRGGKDA